MLNIDTQLITNLIMESVGVKMSASLDPTEARTGLSFWFSNYNRGDGPIFTIRPLGIKRHAVTLRFGHYARLCIEHINSRYSDDCYKLAYALIEELNKDFDLKLNSKVLEPNWSVSTNLKIEVLRKVYKPDSTDEILNTISLIMVPIIAAFAELIGYEDQSEYSDEGKTYTHQITTRERSRRNRLLCLKIHGEKCKVCGFQTSKDFNSQVSSIIEVHHIVPISSLGAPRKYDPRTDLVPLCPNCHRAIHQRNPPYTPDELKGLLLHDRK